MYRAKGLGKNGYRLFDERIKQEIEEKLKIEHGIRECLEQMNSNYIFNRYTIRLKEELQAWKHFYEQIHLPFLIIIHYKLFKRLK